MLKVLRKHIRNLPKSLEAQEERSETSRIDQPHVCKEANRLKDKLASKNVNSVNANLVESSTVNKDMSKQDKMPNGRTSEKV